MTVKNTLFKIFYKFHIYAGIFIAIHFAILSVTGLVLLFKHETQGHQNIQLEDTNTRENFAEKYNQALINLQTKYPHDRPLDMYPDERNPHIIKGRFGVDGATQLRGAKRVTLDFNSGQEIAQQKKSSQTEFFDSILSLHRELFLGANGQIYIGFVGIIYVFLLISGFLIYGRFMKKKEFGAVHSSGRMPNFKDLHKFVGVVSFGWALVIGITGTLLAFNPVFMKRFQENNLHHLYEQYQNFQDTSGQEAPLRDILNTALTYKVDSVISYIVFPGMERGIPAHYLVLMHGTTPLTQQLSEYLVINAQTAKLVEVMPLSLSVEAALVSRPLHFGNYNGILLKIIWAFFTICSLAVAIFGFVSFFVKRRNNSASTQRQKEIPTLRPNQPSILSQCPYVAPTFFLILSGIGILIPLFIQNIFRFICTILLFIPLCVSIFGTRKNVS